MTSFEVSHKRIYSLHDETNTKEDLLQKYETLAQDYDADQIVLSINATDYIPGIAEEFCPGPLDQVSVLDVGCGTGLVGQKMYNKGFRKIDGIDPSPKSLEEARKKGCYRKFICEYFTSEPLDIPADTYDMVVTCGTFVVGHLPFDCLKEMVRLVRPGGIVCIVARTTSLDGSIKYYEELVPLMKKLEADGRWRQLAWRTFPDYIHDASGCQVVFEVMS